MKGVLIVVAACSAPIARPVEIASLDGLWAGDVALDVGPHGTLELAPTPAGWHAQLGGLAAELAPDGGTLGSGHLHVSRSGDRVTAHWAQPATATDGAFATPIALVPSGEGYRGEIEPLPAELHIAVVIAGAHAFVREPGHNVGKVLGELTVEQTGARIAFRDRQGIAIEGTRDGGVLHLRFPRFDLAVDATRRARDTAPYFYARGAGASSLAPVAAGSDGWPVATPEAVGIDREALAGIVADLASDVPDGPSTRAVHALVIVRHGKLVAEEYFAGDRDDVLHDTRSAAKSFSTTIAGIAIDHGQLALDTPLAPDDPAKRPIELQHLLSMSTGLACDDNDDASPGNEDRMQNQTAQPDWYRYALGVPVAHPPGIAAYCSATMNLVGEMVQSRTGGWLGDTIVGDLFEPLGIRRYALPLMPDGQVYFGGGVHLTARDFAKLAQVFLDGGTWHGQRIVSAAWVTAATAAHASLNQPGDYGYGWWRTTYGELAAYYQSGNGGQIAMAIPALDLVIAIQAGNYNAFGIWKHELDELIPRIIASVIR